MRGIHSLRSLALRSSSVFFIRVAGAGFGFLFNLVLARQLGASGAGAFALALTAMIVGSVVIRIGLDTATLKFASAATVNGDQRTLKSLERQIALLVVPSGVAIGLTCAAWPDAVASHVFAKPEVATALRALGLALLPYALLNLYGELLKASGRSGQSSLIQGTAIPGLALLGVVFLGATTAEHVGFIYLATCTLVLLLAAVWWRQAVSSCAASTDQPLGIAKLVRTALPLYAGSLAGVAMVWADLLVLGYWAPASEVGIYNAAVRTGMLTSFVLLAVNTVTAPRLSALAHEANHGELKRLAQQAAFVASIATMPVIFAFAFWGDWILELFGPEFSEGWAALVIIALGQFVNAATGPVGYLLVMTGHHNVEGRISVLAAVLNIGLSVLLIPRYGIIGAAVANAGSVAACNLARLYFARKHTGILVLPLPASPQSVTGNSS